MPCDQIIRTQVQFLERSTDLKLLKKSLEQHGFSVRQTATGLTFSRGWGEQGSYEARTGKLTLPESVDVNDIKVGYSKEVVNDQAAKFGWNVDWAEDEEGNPTTKITKTGW
jgi:hypothetical protein